MSGRSSPESPEGPAGADSAGAGGAARVESAGAVGRHALAIFGSTGVGLVLGFGTTLLTARLLGPSGQGLLTAVRVDASILMAVLALGTPASLWYYASRNDEDVPSLMSFSLVHAAALLVVAGVLAAVLGSAIADLQGASGDEEVFLLGAALVPAVYLEYVYIYMLRGRMRMGLANVASIAGKGAGLVLTVVLVAMLDIGVVGALLAVISISLVQVVLALPVLLDRGLGAPFAMWREILGYGVRAQVGLLFRFAADRFDVLLLTLFVPLSTVGYYAVALVVAELVVLIPRAFGSILGPVVARGDASAELTGRILRMNGSVTLLAVIALAVVGPVLIVVGYGDAFEPSVVPFLVLLPGMWLIACGEPVGFVLSARGRPGAASWLAAFQGVATIVLDLLLIPSFGLTGAAVASALAYASTGLLSLHILARTDGTSVGRLMFVRRAELAQAITMGRAFLRRA